MRRKKRHHDSIMPKKRYSWMRLGDLPSGRKGIVRRLRGGGALTSRLTAMGISLGAELVVVQNFGRGPIIIKVRNTRVALGRGEAAHIRVEAIDE
jgi:ferrous iron transport protein A